METKRVRVVNIDLKNTTSIPIPQFIQGDTNILDFRITNGGIPIDYPTIGKIVVNYKRLDGEVVPHLLTPKNGELLYQLGAKENELHGYGDVELQFFSKDNLDRLSTMRFKIHLAESIGTYSIDEHDKNLTLLQELFIQVEELMSGISMSFIDGGTFTDTYASQSKPIDGGGF